MNFLDLLTSLPEHRLVPPDRRHALLEAVAGVIDAAGGVLDLPFETHLYFAHGTE